ncbi:MAG: hypothetical protein HZB51_01410 [Chloroflexi bacterium]|nr:hypothetical protein [Chloroflexota bacterium]
MKSVYIGSFILLVVALLFFAYPSIAIATPPASFPDSQLFTSTPPEPELRQAGVSRLALSALTARTVDAFPSLEEFVASVKNGDAHSIAGVYVQRVLALRIVQQPANDPVYVSTEMGTATQFRLASSYGTLGLLAHNDRSGIKFFDLRKKQEVDVVYGDGTIRRYSVKNIRRFKPIRSEDPYSDFLDVDNGGALISSSQVFQQIFVGSDQVVFQTCIAADGNPTWGRLFVTATPMAVN